MQWSNEWLRTLPRMLTYIIKKEQKVQGLFTLFLNFFLFFFLIPEIIAIIPEAITIVIVIIITVVESILHAPGKPGCTKQ